jgi:catechol 2,3-dioxygenase-like lactoylglutathione lyase family enzyme
MQRFHVSLAVADLDRSVGFYRCLFGREPVILKSDYAKWLLDEPAINFSLTPTSAAGGIGHVGIQFDTLDELEGVRERLRDADVPGIGQSRAECCYAESDKIWARDPDGVVWEAFVTHRQRESFGEDYGPVDFERHEPAGKCCA